MFQFASISAEQASDLFQMALDLASGHPSRIHRDDLRVEQEQGVQKVGYKRPPVHTQFKKGASGNPGGVKKGTVFIAEAYKRMLAMSPEELAKYKPKSVAEEIAMRQARDAKGDIADVPSLPAAREITDRTEGKAPQTVNLNADVANADITQRIIVEQAISALVRLCASAGLALSREQARARIQELQRETEPLQITAGEGRR